MTERPALFDPAAYRAWLEQTSVTADGEFSKYDAFPDLATGWQRHDGNGGWLASVVLDALRYEIGQQVWVYGPGVSDLKIWATEAAESGPDGGVTAEVTVDGVRLSLGHIPADELITTEHDLLPGYEAAELALTALAERINLAADHFRENRPATPVGEFWGAEFESLTGEQVHAALVTLAELWSSGSTEDLSTVQTDVADTVVALWREDTAVDAEIVD